MKTIKFTDQEYESMIMMYLDELAEAQEYVEHIKDILKKLNANPDKEIVAKQPQKKVRKAQVKAVEKKEPQKRGRKPTVVLPDVESQPAVLPVKKAVAKKTGPKSAMTKKKVKTRKPALGKNAKVKHVDESVPVEPTIAPTA